MKATRALLACLMFVSLSGCASVIQTIAATQNSDILNPDSVQGDRTKRTYRSPIEAPMPEEQAAHCLRGSPTPTTTDDACPATASPDRNTGAKGVGGATAQAVNAGASTTGVTTVATADAANHVSNGQVTDPCGTDPTFFCYQRALAADKSNPNTAKMYISVGITLSDELCHSWFTRLYLTQVTLKQSSDSISSLGTLTAAIEAFSRSTTQAIGLTTSAFGVGKQLNDSIANNYVIDADLTTIEEAVRNYRAIYANQIESTTSTSTAWNYFTARRVVMAYDNTCSAVFVKRFVNAKISGNGASTTTSMTDQAMTLFLANSTAVFPTLISQAQAADLYAVLFVLPVSPDDTAKTNILAELSAAKVVDASNNVVFAGSGKAKKSANDFMALLIKYNLDGVVRNLAIQRIAQPHAAPAAAAQSSTGTITAPQAVPAAPDGRSLATPPPIN